MLVILLYFSLVVPSLGDPDVGFKGELIERNVYVSYRTSGCRFLREREKEKERETEEIEREGGRDM